VLADRWQQQDAKSISKCLKRSQLCLLLLPCPTFSPQLTLVDQLGHGKEAGAGGAGREQEARRVAYFLYRNLRASGKRTYIQQSGGCAVRAA
jgi:hypothetical protein